MAPFFGELYLRTTQPFLDPQVTRVEAEFIADALQLLPHERVLDLCCGHGRHLELLRARGYRAFGLEKDAASFAPMAVAAQRASIRGDLYQLPFSATFDAVYCWYASLYLSTDDAVNRRALGEAARVLPPGGRLLIHGHNPVAQRRSGTSHFETVLNDGARLIEDTWFVPEMGVLRGHRSWELAGRRLEGEFQVRCPSLEDHRAWAREVGLTVEAAWGSVAAEPPAETAPDVIVLIRRPKR